MKIGIIGGGASGLVCAITAKTKDNEVIILERNNECGKKILATGNGRCNYWNDDQNLKHYQSSTKELISNFINEETDEYVMNFFDNVGIVPKIKDGYYYPKSNQAITMRNILVEEALARGVLLKNNYLVEKIEKKNNQFIINDSEVFDVLVLATGSCASPKTGSDGMGYTFLKKMNHRIVKPLPSLVQLCTKKYSFLNKWKGIRSDVRVSLLKNTHSLEDDNNCSDKTKEIENSNQQQEGEIQLTDYGISGICVFNLSGEVARMLDRHEKVTMEIDFLPDFNVIPYLQKNKSIRRVLACLLNERLVDILLEEANILKNKKYLELDNQEKSILLSKIHRFELEIVSTKSFLDAQVASGGISLDEINIYMESKKVKNLYVVGELLDLTGECGGYNLGVAWRSGIVAGMAIRGDFND